MLVAGTGVLILLVLYFFGNTVPPQKKPDARCWRCIRRSCCKNLLVYRTFYKNWTAHLTPAQLSYAGRLQQSVVRGDVVAQQLMLTVSLPDFWKDSVQSGFLLYAYYTGEAAKLENSEKSLTFAAREFLHGLQGQDNQRS